MKNYNMKKLIVLVILTALTACSNNTTKPETEKPATPSANQSLPTPTKEILVTDGDLNKTYNILGEIETSMETASSIYSNQIELARQGKDLIKKVAFSKYGEKVDSVIHYKVQETVTGGFWGGLGAAYGAHNVVSQVSGIAIQFVENIKESPAQKEPAATEPGTKASKTKKKAR